MEQGKIDRIKQLGFTISEAGRNKERFVSMQTIPSKETVLRMLRELDFEDSIIFWDYYHITVTDPGGYVRAYMIDEKKAVYMEGNHGWSSRFAAISIDDLADLMIKNWDKDCDDGMYYNSIKICPHYDSQRDLYLYRL